MIQLFLIPTLVALALVVLLCVLPIRWRNALIWGSCLLIASAWGKYFFDAATPGHDSGVGEALGLLVMAWVSIVFALGAALSVWLRAPAHMSLVANRSTGDADR